MNIAFLHGVKKLTLHVIPGETDTVVLSIIRDVMQEFIFSLSSSSSFMKLPIYSLITMAASLIIVPARIIATRALDKHAL